LGLGRKTEHRLGFLKSISKLFNKRTILLIVVYNDICILYNVSLLNSYGL